MNWSKYDVVLKKVGEDHPTEHIESSGDAFSFICKTIRLNEFPDERFYVISLSTKLDVIGYTEVSKGGIARATVEPRAVFRTAILQNAASIIVCHNHPSGDTVCSADDREITRALVGCGELLGIQVADHIIVGDIDASNDDMFSFNDEGLIAKWRYEFRCDTRGAFRISSTLSERG